MARIFSVCTQNDCPVVRYSLGIFYQSDRGGQSVTAKSSKLLTNGLARVCAVRMPSWGPRGAFIGWFQATGDWLNFAVSSVLVSEISHFFNVAPYLSIGDAVK